MNKKTISTMILVTSLSFVGGSYAVAANQQGMKNGQQHCANQTQEMAGNQNCMNNAGEMKQKGKNKSASMENGKRHGNKHGHKHSHKNSYKQGNKNQNMGFAKLNLSAEQKQKIDVIMAKVKEDKLKIKLANRASMQALMANETFDTDAAKSLMTYQQQQKAENRLAMLKAKHEVFQLLTDEQKAKFSEMKLKRQKR